jgi:ArsR family transcriptional regulator, virulence genes transcriptional regulator
MEQALASPIADIADQADEVAALLSALANGPRLLVMCHLAAAGELPAGDLVSRIGLSQSALSQHLAKLRQRRLVAYRREGQSLLYRIADPKVLRVLELMHELYCPELKGNHT